MSAFFLKYHFWREKLHFLAPFDVKKGVFKKKVRIFWNGIIIYRLWENFSPIGSFLMQICHFSFFHHFVLEIPEKRGKSSFFADARWENVCKISNLAPTAFKFSQNMPNVIILKVRQNWSTPINIFCEIKNTATCRMLTSPPPPHVK